MLDHGGTLNGSPAPGGERIYFRITGQLLAGSGIDGNHLDPVPKGAEKHPNVAVQVYVTGRIDGVVIIGGRGLEDQTLIRPFVIRRGRIQCGIGGHANHGVIGSKGGTGVINPVSPVTVPGIGRPDVGDGRTQQSGHPGRDRRNDVPLDRPVDLVGGLPDLQQVVGGEQGVDAPGVANNRWIMGSYQHFGGQGTGTSDDNG